jgi:uncharacterized protein YkwD
MTRSFHPALLVSTLLTAFLLSACGGGGSNSASSGGSGNSGGSSATTASVQCPNALPSTGNTATDGFNQFNCRRQQLGLATLTRNSIIDTAAQGHSNYQMLNNTITHTQTAGNPGFTGATLGDRLTAAGYQFGGSYAYGEVISSTSDPSGALAAEDLITAIYHRFVIFEPMFQEAGAGAATVPNGVTYFTTDFVNNGLTGGIGSGQMVNYPVNGQTNIPTNFFSDNESPDPVPGQNEVGYPISMHADIISTVTVQSFTVQPHGGSPLSVKLLTNPTDSQTPASAAAIIPLSVLSPGTTYDVQFSGTVDGVPVNRSWSFTTQSS